ncbi:hypothetical protein [Hungatella hathewayi]|uniref:Uncharacterized protein n=1 Tax=Hungatella hathewayi DSM 13479 TaxID=566550 RepID=D3AGS3_9FIRM|nr:hypothetical protein [Hungatella hathewayi]EFC98980.1 hypothetical protein CLOSTHATH_02809 [Hungatella hathewayi DSM 13479]
MNNREVTISIEGPRGPKACDHAGGLPGKQRNLIINFKKEVFA